MKDREVYCASEDFVVDGGTVVRAGECLEVISMNVNSIRFSRYIDGFILSCIKVVFNRYTYYLQDRSLDSVDLRRRVRVPQRPLPIGTSQTLCPGMDVIMDEDPKPIFNKKCECGAHAVGIQKHSDYCQLYSKEQQ